MEATSQRILGCRADALATARALVGRQDAEDVAQEALLRALEAARRGVTIEEPTPYLRAIVRNVAIDRLRATRGEVPVAEPPEPASREASPHVGAELGQILDAIADLPPGQRKALLGTLLTQHSQRRLAQALQTSPAGLRQLVRRARLRLREIAGVWVPGLALRAGDLLAAASPAARQTAAVGAIALAIAMPSAPALPDQPASPTMSSLAHPVFAQPPAAPSRPSS